MEEEMMGDDGGEDDEYSAMAWTVAAKGKSGREIGCLHETWANAQTARGALDKAQVLRSRKIARCRLHIYEDDKQTI